MRWLRLRLPYLVLVGFAFVAFSIHSGDIDKLTKTQHALVDTQGQLKDTQGQLKAAVARLDSVFATGTRGSCMSRNQLRNGLVGFVADSADRSRKAAAATIASPNATADQKKVAAANLAQITQTLDDLKGRLPLQDCPKGTP